MHTLKIPNWLKIAAILLVASIFLSILGAISQFLITPLLIFALILFPGSKQKEPRLVRFAPWLYTLGFFAALGLITANFFGKELLPPDVRKPTDAELWSNLAFSPILMWALLRRHLLLKPLLIFSAGLSLILSSWVYFKNTQEFNQTMEYVADLLSVGMLTIYLLIKVKTPQQ